MVAWALGVGEWLAELLSLDKEVDKIRWFYNAPVCGNGFILICLSFMWSAMCLTWTTHANSLNTHTRLTALRPGLPGWAGTRKVKTNLDFIEARDQETVSGISWAICKSAPRRRQITMPAPHHPVFYRPDALPTASKHWRKTLKTKQYSH